MFLHFWGKGPAEELARGMNAARDAEVVASKLTRYKIESVYPSHRIRSRPRGGGTTSRWRHGHSFGHNRPQGEPFAATTDHNVLIFLLRRDGGTGRRGGLKIR